MEGQPLGAPCSQAIENKWRANMVKRSLKRKSLWVQFRKSVKTRNLEYRDLQKQGKSISER